jgi:hypothetical protein
VQLESSVKAESSTVSDVRFTRETSAGALKRAERQEKQSLDMMLIIINYNNCLQQAL